MMRALSHTASWACLSIWARPLGARPRQRRSRWHTMSSTESGGWCGAC